MTTAAPEGGSTIRRIVLGSRLRKLREAKGITREDAGYTIRASASKMSRLEAGRVSFKERDVADLLTLYGIVDSPERDALLTLVRGANQAAWWQPYHDLLPGWFQVYVGLEEAATLIRTFEIQFIPGLLQTEAYARAVIARGQPQVGDAEMERRVNLRMARQRLLTRPDPPRLWAILDEAVLRRAIGGAHVMRTQITHLLDVAARPNITLQILPFEVGGHAAEGGAFTILRFADAELADVVYLEQLTSSQYLDKEEDTARYAQVMERISVDSLRPAQTLDVLAAILKGI